MRSLAVLVASCLALAACSAASDEGAMDETTTTPAPAPSTTVVTSAPPPTTAPGSLGYENLVRTDVVRLGTGDRAREVEVDVYAPAQVGPWPVVVTVHGGGWFGGNRSSMGPLADGLADRKVVAFNTGYNTISRGGSFPGMVDDIACAVQHARTVASEFTTTPQRVAVVGHSAGAHLASLVAYAPSEFGRACPDGPMQGPDGFVGLAGPYDISNLDFLLEPMFGGTPDQVPELWASGNPYTWLADSPDIPTLLIHGEEDRVAPVSFSEDLEIALLDAGRTARLEVLFERNHADANAPGLVADRIARFAASLGADTG